MPVIPEEMDFGRSVAKFANEIAAPPLRITGTLFDPPENLGQHGSAIPCLGDAPSSRSQYSPPARRCFGGNIILN